MHTWLETAKGDFVGVPMGQSIRICLEPTDDGKFNVSAHAAAWSILATGSKSDADEWMRRIRVKLSTGAKVISTRE